MSNLKDHPYNVVPIVGEPLRYYVNSKSRPSMQHIVDLAYVEEGRSKPKPACGCEHNHIRGAYCEHIKAVVDYLLRTHKKNWTDSGQ